MGFFEKMYKEGPQRTRSEKLYDDALLLMNDVEKQNERLPENIRETVLAGNACDTVPGASGNFGHDIHNPIPVNGPIGEFSYLSRLRMKSTGGRVFFHKLRTIGPVDEFELTNVSGQFADHLFLDPWHRAQSGWYPHNYYLEREAVQPRGITTTCPDFPRDLYKLIKKEAKRWLSVDVAEKEAQYIHVEEAQASLQRFRNKDNSDS